MGMDSVSLIRIALALLFPAALSAQQGTIAYTFSHQYDFEVPEGWEEMMADSETGTVVLHFGPSGSLMTRAPDKPDASGGSGGRMISDRWLRRMLWMKRQSASRRDQEIVRDTWVSYEQGTLVETREFMGRTFRIAGSPPQYAWRLTAEQAEHLGRMVIKATAEQDGTSIEAWFTPEIPVSGVPPRTGASPG